ncbi:GIP [Symbiodinium sp. CCMP2592]|nr:GIP [Symbiodinium sp. CCMP2592]
MGQLDTVPVTLAGDSRQNWLRTAGGTLVVPPLPQDNEDQALKLIAELESRRLASFREEVQNLECRIESMDKPLDPTEAWKQAMATGKRKEVLRALIAQPYLADVSEEVVARLAEDFGSCDEVTGQQHLKALPLRRSKRRALLSSKRWLVHLCSGKPKPCDPISQWCEVNKVAVLNVDLSEPGGKGWDLTKRNAVWRVLMWAAASARVVAVFASPPHHPRPGSEVLIIQDQVLWSLASVARGAGVPYVREVPLEDWKDHQAFLGWSGARVTTLNQVSNERGRTRKTCLLSNLELGCLGQLDILDENTESHSDPIWSIGLRRHLSTAMSGRPTGTSCEVLDSIIRSASCAELHVQEQQHLEDLEEERLNAMFEQESVISSSEEESDDVVQVDDLKDESEDEDLRVKEVKDVSEAELEGWKRHLLSGHVPYRRDCRQCVEGAALGTFHSRIKYPRMYTLSIDLFGPVPIDEAGRDETCVTGKCTLRYGLVGAFRLPRSVIGGKSSSGKADDSPAPRDGADVIPAEIGEDDFRPFEVEPELFPELFDGDLDVPVVSAVGSQEVGTSLFDATAEVPEDPNTLRDLVHDLNIPVDHAVLRFFTPLRTKTGAEVTEAVQQMILRIMQEYPVHNVHHDPGTEFSSTNLQRWLSEKGITVSNSLPTDKKGNGLAERTVGWVKSRVRTLLKGAELPTHWWPLAARWAVHRHNVDVLSLPAPPAFAQPVLHRIKRPADAKKALMERWTEARYGAPHRTIPRGHVLITAAGNLVASKGFKAGTIDPNKLEGLDLPVVQEEEGEDEPPLPPPDEPPRSVELPSRRMRTKSRVSFVDGAECNEPEVEVLAGRFLLDEDYSNDAFRQVAYALQESERPSIDRRGEFESKYVIGAFCHGGKRGVTNLCKKLPRTSRFLNKLLKRRASLDLPEGHNGWSAVMILHATEIGLHKDVRNEWGTRNIVHCIPGEVQLRVEPSSAKGDRCKGNVAQTYCLSSRVTEFDARIPHSVHKQPDWLIVGYTPLGTAKIAVDDIAYLEELGFRFNLQEEPAASIRMVRSVLLNEASDSSSSEDSGPPPLEPITPRSDLEQSQDEQEDSVTQPVGWDVSTNGVRTEPVMNLEETDFYEYLLERGAEGAFQRLTVLGVQEASDLPFLYEEDLLEFGLSPLLARRVMKGIHPAGTVRPDPPNLTALTTGEVQLIDRLQRKIPWIFQNRTLGFRSPGPPVPGLGVKGEDRLDEGDWIVSEERREREQRWIDYCTRHAQDEDDRVPVGQGLSDYSFQGPTFPRHLHPETQQTPASSSDGPSLPPSQLNSSVIITPIEVSTPGGNEEVRLAHSANRSPRDWVPTTYEDYAEYCMSMQDLWDRFEDASSDDDPNQEECVSEETPSPPCRSEEGLSSNYHCKMVSLSAPSTDYSSSDPIERQGTQGATAASASSASARIGVSTLNPLATLSEATVVSYGVSKIDDSFYTPNVEELLRGLSVPLKVVHNVSPAEVKRHLECWTPSARAEVGALEGMRGITRLKGSEALRAAAAPDAQVLPAKTVFTVKPGSDGSLYRRKCRVVGCGNYEDKDPSLELYASGVPSEVLRAILIECAVREFQAFITDIKNAFLLAPLPVGMHGRILLRPPKVLEAMGITEPNEIWQVCKAVYGLRQSPRWWSEYRDSVLRTATWEGVSGQTRLCQSSVEGNVWKLLNDKDELVGYALVYVDDIMFLTSPAEAQCAYAWLRSTWQCTPLEGTVKGNHVTFLGVEIYQGFDEQGNYGFLLGQKGYIEELLRSYQLEPKHHTPLPREWVRELPCEESNVDPDTLRRAQKITGELLWLTQRTRVDAAFAVSQMGSWCTRAPTYVVKIGLRLLDFLGSTMDFKLSLIPIQGPKRIVVYSDASFSPHGSHSISGILVTFLGRAVTWKAKRQTLISLSTAESELIAGCEAVVLAQSTEAMIEDLTKDLENKLLLVDNLAAISLAEGAGSMRTRHLRVRSNFVKEMVDTKELEVEHCPGEYQLADLLTKVLASPRHLFLSWLVGLGPEPAEARVALVGRATPPVQNPDLTGVRLKMVLLILVLQMMESEASVEDDELQEPLSLELSVLAVMMLLSALFVWETGKYCLARCCRDEPRISMIRVDEDDASARRQRRQEVVRRAIDTEIQGLNLRRRRGGDDALSSTQDVAGPVIQVNVGGNTNERLAESPPPIPRFVNQQQDEVQVHVAQAADRHPMASSSSSLPSPTMLHNAPGVQPPAQGTSVLPTRREIAVQTDFPRGLTHEEMCSIDMITTSSRTPGAIHLFPDCHALRSVSGTNRRMFCRYCLTTAARSGI